MLQPETSGIDVSEWFGQAAKGVDVMTDPGPDGLGVGAADRVGDPQVSPGTERAEDRDAKGLQRSIDRLVYGDRADPYRTLAMLGRRLEESQALDAVLPTVAATVADALRVPYAAVQVSRGPEPGAGRFQGLPA